MFKNIFKKKQSIEAQAVVDLREYTPQALNNIKSIEAVALLILPENPSSEFIEAFSKIKLDAVGFKLNLPIDKKIAMFNGVTSLSSIKLADNTVGVFNGIVIIGQMIENENSQYIVNGIVLKKSGLQNNGQCLMENGLIFEMDFDENKVKLFSNKINIDASFIRNVEDGTLIAAGDTITFNNDITEEIIVEKNLQFFAGNKIKCNKNVKGCIQARSCVGNKIVSE
ncbi:MAG: hypothetical protein IJA80_05260 [Clostridia bacterium]|nr:hypothetical protein [Clostridia bacterium]